jgi:hypothetical protein
MTDFQGLVEPLDDDEIVMPYTYPTREDQLTTDRRQRERNISEAAETLRSQLVEDLPVISGVGILDCPCCHRRLHPEDFVSPTYAELEKLRTWTVAQLIAFGQLQERSGISFRELLARTSAAWTERPGIGGALAGSQGMVGVNDFHGMFIGIEPDGYTHS